MYCCKCTHLMIIYVILQSMARSQHWDRTNLKKAYDLPFPIANARGALVYKLICGGRCDVAPDIRIPDTLASFNGQHRSGCECVYCEPHYSEIGVASSIGSSNSIYDMSNTWSDDSFEVDNSNFIVMHSVHVSSSSSVNEDSGQDMESDDYDTQRDLFDDSQNDSDSEVSSCFNSTESNVSISGVETLSPASGPSTSFNVTEAHGSFSDAETQWPAGVPFPKLRSTDFDSDSSSKSVSILKRKR